MDIVSVRVCIVALPSVLGSSVCGPMDVLGTANLLSERRLFSVSVHTPGREPPSSSYGLVLGAKPGLPRSQQHIVLVPGFGVTAMAGAAQQVESEVARQARLCRWLRRQSQGGAIVAANCAGTFVLAEAGLLDGRTATTSWWLKDAFAARYPGVHLDADALVSEGGSVLTAGAAMSHLDLALHLVERFGGAALARACAKVLVLDRGRHTQAAYTIPDHARSQDAVVREAIACMKAELSRPRSMAALASSVGVTARTLNRKFRHALGTTPLQYRCKLRIDEARRRLEQPGQSVDAVARAVGYADASAFYRAFTKAVGLSPRAYQQRFGLSVR